MILSSNDLPVTPHRVGLKQNVDDVTPSTDWMKAWLNVCPVSV